MLPPPPNGLFTAFSFVGFVLCAIPFYWHLEAWNTGTCLYMIWVGLGCLFQFINSIVWSKNMINRVAVYCDIVTHFQTGLNVAIPACSLCINRRLYKIATMKSVVFTSSDKRRAVIDDLLIGIGLPILQILAEYVVSANRYNIFEDFGPYPSTVNTPVTFVVLYAWPVAMGVVSLFYCVTNIYTFYNRERQFRRLMSSAHGLTHGRYIRLMLISTTEILGTIPWATYYIVHDSKLGVKPYSWTSTHRHYSEVLQFPASVWKNNYNAVFALEMFRWSLVFCAFIFFALFGFAGEARRNYRLVYASIANRIGRSTSALHGSSHVTSSPSYGGSNGGAVTCVVKTAEEKRDSIVSFTDQSSISGLERPEFKVEQYSPSNTVTSSSVEGIDESEMQDRSALPAVTMPTVPPATHPPHFHETTRSTLRASSSFDAV